MKKTALATAVAVLLSPICAFAADAVRPAAAAAPATKPAQVAKPKPEKKEEKAGRYADTEYGPFYSSTLAKPVPVQKSITIKVGTAEKPATVSFDTDLLRFAGGWTGGWLKLNTGRDGLAGPATPDGKIVFSTNAIPGWAAPGSDNFVDPRKIPHGPLPREYAKYRGLYLHGDKVVLSYTVGQTAVLELPGFSTEGGVDAFTRTISVAASDEPLAVLLHQGVSKPTEGVVPAGGTYDGKPSASGPATGVAVMESGGSLVAAGVAGAPADATLEVAQGRMMLKLPPRKQPALFTISIASIAPADVPKLAARIKAAPAPQDPAALTKGGPAHWMQEVTTKGVLGTGNGAYVMDTLTIPDENPWKCYMRMTGLDFLPDGRAAVGNIGGDVWIVSGIDDKLEKLTWKRYAAGMFQTLGLRIVDGRIYALGRDQITRLHDLNGDGEADFYENFNNDHMVQDKYHEYALDLHTDAAGNFYYMKGSDLSSGGTPHNGTMLKVSKDGSKTDVVAVGFRAPNGMGVGPNGELTSSDNQGNWTPLCPINWIKPGGFYGFVLKGYPNATDKSPRDPPICWLPMSADNSGGGQVWVTSDKWGPYAGRMLHMSYGKCSLFAVMTQDVGDVKQGGVVRFPFTFTSGSMRARFHPTDGQLYVSGMKGWQTSAGRVGCLHRVRYTGKPANMPLDLAVTKTGVEITFTDPLDPSTAADKDSYDVEVFNVQRTGGYGSKEFSVADPKKTARDPVEVSAASLSADGKKVTLTIPDIKPVTNMVIRFKIKAADGADVSHEIDNTIHAVPQ